MCRLLQCYRTTSCGNNSEVFVPFFTISLGCYEFDHSVQIQKNVNLLKSKTICILRFLINHFDIRTGFYLYLLLKIGLGSRIHDMEVESYN